MYISMHAYSQMWLIPWGYTTDRPQDYSDLYSLAKIGGKALEKVHNTSYLIGTIPDLLYIASGIPHREKKTIHIYILSNLMHA